MKEPIAFLYGQPIGAFRQGTSGALSFQHGDAGLISA